MKKIIFSALAGVLMGAGFQSHAGEMEDNQRASVKRKAAKQPAKRHVFEQQLRAYQAAQSARAKQEARDRAAKNKAHKARQLRLAREKIHPIPLPRATASPKGVHHPTWIDSKHKDTVLPYSSSKGISGSGGGWKADFSPDSSSKGVSGSEHWVKLSDLKSVKCLLPAAPAALNKNPPKGKGSTGRR